MSGKTPIVVKKEPRDDPSKHVFTIDSSTFSPLNDDGGLPTGPALKSATIAEDVIKLSDDENKTLTILEPAKKTSTLLPKKIHNEAAVAPAKKPPNEPRKLKNTFLSQQDVLETLKNRKSPNTDVPKNEESLIQKMRNRLSKQIELKPVISSTSQEMDMSGVIEIPQELILSEDIPPITMTDSKESEMDDHDLIAILEGSVVAIREKESEIEVCVGPDESKDVDNEVQIVSFSIIDSSKVEESKKEREKEIARRQIESLPLLPKVRKPRSKPIVRANKTPLPQGSPVSPSQVPKPPQKEPAVTIMGQTTIRPIVKASSSSPSAIKGNVRVDSSAASGVNVEKVSPKVATAPRKEIAPKPTPVQIKVSPESTQKTSKLVDSLVSDWDDEPALPQDEGCADVKSSITMLPPATSDSRPFAEPPPVVELKRNIKRKVIWDPSDATVPFAKLVKDNRALSTSAGANADAVGSPLRRKRAESVSVRLTDSTPAFSSTIPVRQRAKTPEPPKPAEVKPVEPPKRSHETSVDARAKKRKKNEIERLLADEGAINMLYDVECETNRKDLLKGTDVNTSDEDEKLIAKTKIITHAVINQGKSPTEASPQQGLRVRAKRTPTPLNQSPVLPGAGTVADGTKATISPGTLSTAGIQPAKKAGNGSAASSYTSLPSGARRRKTNALTSKDWDYVYNAQRNEDAMIIRRRSNSSYSSGASPRRLSIDQACEPSPVGAGSSPNTANKPGQQRKPEEGFLFAKPPDKSEITSPQEDVKVNASLVANMRGKLNKVLKGMKGITATKDSAEANSSPPTVNKQSPKQKAIPKSPSHGLPDTASGVEGETKGPKDGEGFDEAMQSKFNKLKQMKCVRQPGYVEIILRSNGTNPGIGTHGGLTNVFSYELMNELSDTLPLLQKESSVRAVLLRSAGIDFSRGLDVGHLIQPVDKRKNVAEDMGICLINFLKTLVAFSKPIIAAVHGDLLGMGVTILPLFDMVLARHGSSFMAPYGHFGYLPEGLSAFTSCRVLKPKTTDLFLLGKRIPASVALEYGLVTEMVQPERFDDRTRMVMKQVTAQSVQAMQSIKLLTRREFFTKMESVLLIEQKKLVQQWQTTECQQKFKQFVERGGKL